MKIRIQCPTCKSSDNLQNNLFVEPNADGNFKIECDNGHKFTMYVLYHGFQILFEIGANAIVDGYYREAIGSFTASYERFLEFFIRIILNDNNIDKELIKQVWKNVSNQSERQLGAYIFLYLYVYKSEPQVLERKQTELRNKVIHKGHIPSKTESIEYGQKILTLIRSVIQLLYKDYKDELVISINYRLPENKEQVNSIYLPWMIIGTNRPPDNPEEKLEDILEKLIKK